MAGVSAALVFLFTGICFFIGQRSYSLFEEGVPGPGFWPFILILLLVGSSGGVTFLELKEARKNKAVPAPSSPGGKTFCYLAFLTGAFLVLWPWLGFLLTSFAFTLGTMMILGERKWLRIVSAAVLSLSVYVLFAYGFRVPLDTF